jgi:tartrate/fumarate subfamily iron-sulfur-dependent hydro-lyase beta chain
MDGKLLKIPLREEEVRALEIGDVVFLSGPVFTGRSLFHIRAIEHGILPPIDFSEVNVLLHAGPMMERAGESWNPVSMTLTASIRFEKYGAEVIEKCGLRAVVGKTTMGKRTLEMLKTFGAVHLTSVGIMTNILPDQVKKVRDVFFLEELGRTEAAWVIELERGGPFIVDMDAKGRNLFHEVRKGVNRRFHKIYRHFGIAQPFKYTESH